MLYQQNQHKKASPWRSSAKQNRDRLLSPKDRRERWRTCRCTWTGRCWSPSRSSWRSSSSVCYAAPWTTVWAAAGKIAATTTAMSAWATPRAASAATSPWPPRRMTRKPQYRRLGRPQEHGVTDDRCSSENLASVDRSISYNSNILLIWLIN